MSDQVTFSPQLAGNSSLWELRSRPNQRRPRPSTQQKAQKVRDQLTLHRKPPVKDLSEAQTRTENQGLNKASIQTKLQRPFVCGIEKNGSVAEILADFCQKHKLSGVYIQQNLAHKNCIILPSKHRNSLEVLPSHIDNEE